MLKLLIPNVSFEGRANRQQFWAELLVSWYWIPFLVGGFTVAAYRLPEAAGSNGLIDFRSVKTLVTIVLFGIGAANLVGTIGLVVRRLRDLGKTPSAIANSFVPLIALLAGLVVSALVPPFFFVLMTVAPLFFLAQLVLLYRLVFQLGFGASALGGPPPFEGFAQETASRSKALAGILQQRKPGELVFRLNGAEEIEDKIRKAARDFAREAGEAFRRTRRSNGAVKGASGPIKRATAVAMRPNPRTGRTTWASGLISGPWG